MFGIRGVKEKGGERDPGSPSLKDWRLAVQSFWGLLWLKVARAVAAGHCSPVSWSECYPVDRKISVSMVSF